MNKIRKIPINNLLNSEIIADLRNKLQTTKTALELLRDGKKVPKEFINKALNDLETIEKYVDFKFNERESILKRLKGSMTSKEYLESLKSLKESRLNWRI